MSPAPRAADGRGLDGRLAPCPASPNCVCSEAGQAGASGGARAATGAAATRDAAHDIAAFTYAGAAPLAWAALRELVRGWPRTRVVLHTPDYLRAEFTSRVFRFVDDVEFRLDAAAGAIHVRSASRLGYSDLGANRKRVEALREAFRERQMLGAAPGA